MKSPCRHVGFWAGWASRQMTAPATPAPRAALLPNQVLLPENYVRLAAPRSTMLPYRRLHENPARCYSRRNLLNYFDCAAGARHHPCGRENLSNSAGRIRDLSGGGFFTKKHLAVTIVSDPEKADYSLKQLRWIASRKARAAKSRAACSPTALEFKARNRPACV